MEIVRCSKGHFYDSEENSTCPLCAAEDGGGKRIFDNILPTDAFVTRPENRTEKGPRPTEPVGYEDNKVQKYKPTVGVGYVNTKEGGSANPVRPYPKTEPVPIDGNATGEAAVGFNPVVGWLVCIDGPTRGTAYEIHSQYNFIGRSEKMDVSIPEDPHISAENSAVVAYDNAERVFFFGPGSGHNGVRVNEKMILNATMINAYDVLTVGLTKLLFVPLCGDRFDWNEEK